MIFRSLLLSGFLCLALGSQARAESVELKMSYFQPDAPDLNDFTWIDAYKQNRRYYAILWFSWPESTNPNYDGGFETRYTTSKLISPQLPEGCWMEKYNSSELTRYNEAQVGFTVELKGKNCKDAAEAFYTQPTVIEFKSAYTLNHYRSVKPLRIVVDNLPTRD